jgi:hypothetical protein
MPRLVGWWLVPIAWAVAFAVDWLIYGTPLAWVARAPTTDPFWSYIAMLLDPTVGVVVGGVLLLPLVFRPPVTEVI